VRASRSVGVRVEKNVTGPAGTRDEAGICM
jgi:hypothetical protein